MATISDWYLVKRGKNYSYGFRIDGKPILKTCKTSDKTKAEQVAKEAWTLAKRDGEQGFNPLTERASVLFQDYKDRKLKNRSDKTKGLHENFVFRFNEHFKKDPILYSISKRQIEDFRDWLLEQSIRSGKRDKNAWTSDKKLSRKTVIEIINWLGAVYKYHGIPNPVQGVAKPPLSKDEALEKSITFWTKEQEENIFKASKGTSFELPLRILWFSGMRPAEMLYLKNDTSIIDKDSRTVKLVDKKRHVRILDLANNDYVSQAWGALIEWIKVKKIKEGEPLFPYEQNWARKRWQVILKNAEIEYRMLHQIRHQFVKHCFHVLGWDLTTISMWCGHSTDMCYQTYSKVLLQSPKSNNSEETTIISPNKRIEEKIAGMSSSKFDFVIEGQVKHEGRYVDSVTISKTDWDKHIAKAYEW